MKINDAHELGNEIRRLRNKKELSVSDVAMALNIRPRTLLDLEESKLLSMGIETLSKLATILGVDRDHLSGLQTKRKVALAKFLAKYESEVIALVDALKIYSSSEIQRHIREIIQTYIKKGGGLRMATKSTKSGGSKAAAKKPAKPAPKKAAAKRSTSKKSK